MSKNENGFIKLEGKGVDIEIGKYDVRVEGKSLHTLIRNAIGITDNSDYGDTLKIRGKITIHIEEEGQEISSISNLNYGKGVMNNG